MESGERSVLTLGSLRRVAMCMWIQPEADLSLFIVNGGNRV